MSLQPGRDQEPVSGQLIDRLLVSGLSHRSAGQDLRDEVFIEEAELAGTLSRLTAEGFDEAMVVSTCDRVEVWGLAADPVAASRKVAEVLGARAGREADDLAPALVSALGFDGLVHIFSVAAALDAQITGEPEILGQVKAAERAAMATGAVGPGLGRLLDAAYGAAKRVRNETLIGENAVSMAAAAVQVAREVVGGFERATALLLGAGEIGVLVAGNLVARGLGEIRVADPVPMRAEALAANLGGRVIPFDDAADALSGTDIVLAGIGGTAPAVTKAALAVALKVRRQRPMFLLDAALPSDIEAGADALDAAFIFNLDDLERIALLGREKRDREAASGRALIAEEAAAFVLAEGGRAAAPAVAALRAHFEDVRNTLLAEQPGLDAEAATRLLVNRLLHAPSQALRDSADGDRAAGLDFALGLFGVTLPGTKQPQGEQDGE